MAVCSQPEHRSRWPPSAAVRQRVIAVSTFSCCPLIHLRLRSMKPCPAWRTMSAISSGDRLIRWVSLLRMLRTAAYRADWRLRSGACWKGADRSWSLRDRDGRAGSGWCAGRHLLRADASQSNDVVYADESAYAPGQREPQPADTLTRAPWS